MAGKDNNLPLTRKQQIFVDEYLKCFNASEAARRAGYTGKADVIGCQLLSNISIKALIDARIAESHMSADEALRLLAEMARGERPTKKIISDTEDSETFDTIAALDKVLRAHGKYKDNLDLTTGGEKITVRLVSDATN